jgi:hypothetical protein
MRSGVLKLRLDSAYGVVNDIRSLSESLWYGNYLGPGDGVPKDQLGKFVKPIDKLDAGALQHDLGYNAMCLSWYKRCLRARDEISCSFSFVFLTDSVVAILVT